MSDNADAKDFLDYYLGREGDPEYAVLLEGAWGSGKSYFVERYFEERFKAAKAKNKDAKDPLIHVTLFGIRDLADITTQMFEKAHPNLGGKVAKGANFLLSKAVGIFGPSVDPKESAGLLQDLALNLNGRVIVFDDLERCPIPLVEVMGYINQFVEHRKLHVIVVASEEDVQPEQLDDYRRRKEKVIGKTIRVGSDPAEVIVKFAEILTSQALKNVVANQTAKILATISAKGKPNFRSVRAILLDYERLLEKVDERLLSDEDIMLDLLLYMLAVGIEFRSGGLDRKSLAELQSVMQAHLFGSVRASPNEKDLLSQRLRKTYGAVSWNDPVVHPRHLAELFASGSINVTEINNHIAGHPAIAGPAQLPAWRRLWGWFDLGQKDFQQARTEFALQLAAREFTHPGEILHAAGIAVRLQRFGDDLLGGRKPLDYFRDYIEEIVAADRLKAAPSLFGPMRKSYAGLVYNDHDSPTFARVEELVEKAATRALDREMASEVETVMSRLLANPRHTAMLYEWDRDAGYYGEFAMLHHVPASSFADVVLVDGKLNDSVLAALAERYRRNVNLDREYGWLKKVRAEVNKRIAKVPPPHRQLCKLRAEYGFNQIDEMVALARAMAPTLARRRAAAKLVETV
ncbi:P-loop NTPase fold protein [Bosea sp. (in: a-proteobacteria)]